MRAINAMRMLTTVQRVARTPDGGGGFTETWADVTESTVCAAFPLRARGPGFTGALGGAETLATPERANVQELTVVLVPPGTDVNEGDQLTQVTDRRNRVVYRGPLRIDSVGDLPDQIRLVARRIV